jgi:hypothetical protein
MRLKLEYLRRAVAAVAEEQARKSRIFMGLAEFYINGVQ